MTSSEQIEDLIRVIESVHDADSGSALETEGEQHRFLARVMRKTDISPPLVRVVALGWLAACRSDLAKERQSAFELAREIPETLTAGTRL